MPPRESSYPAEWFRIAEKDLARVEQCLRAGDSELAGFCLQQAVEKFLKGFLLKHGWELRRIHDLEALLDDACAHLAGIESFRQVCQRITKFYLMQRYPLASVSRPGEPGRCTRGYSLAPLRGGRRC